MTTAFISYSRKDADFVRRLHDALGAQDRQAWVDWEGIAPTAEWMKEIVGAIDAATAFVFVMTPDSIASQVCLRELAHAAEQNKRLIPVARRDVETSSLPDSLAKVNWIFFRDSDDFAQAVQTLVTAIDTDLDWVRAHTRLLVRAREWDAKNRENSLALRGNDLKAAEQWLTLGPTRQPQPNELQTLYVLQSRKVATNRRYALLGSAMVGLVAVAILGTTTYFGRREAARQQTIAIAGRLTADAELTRNQFETVPADTGWLERSVLLATEAASQLSSVGMRSVQTDIAMRRGLARFPRRMASFTRNDLSPVEAIVLPGDGRVLAASKSPLTIEHYGDDKEQFHSKEAGGGVKSVAFSPDGKFIATTEFKDAPGVVDIWETMNLEHVASFAGLGDAVGVFALSPAAKYLAASSSNFDKKKNEWVPGFTRIWDVASADHRVLASLPDATNLSFSPDGAWLAAIVDAKPKAWKMGSGADVKLQEVDLAATPSDAWSILFSPDAKYLVVGFQDNQVKVWSVGDWKIVSEFRSEIMPRAVSHGGKYVAVSVPDGYTARILDTSEGGEVARAHASNSIDAIAFSPNSEEVAIAGLGKTIDLWQLEAGGSDITRIAAGADVRAASFNPDETALTMVSAAAGKLSTQSWPLADARESPRRTLDLPGELAALSADGRFVAVASAQAVTILNATDGGTVRRLRYQGNATAIAFSPEGAFLAAATDDGVVLLWPTGMDQQPTRFTVPGKVAEHYLAVGPSGTTLAAVATEGVTRAGATLATHFWRPPNTTEVAKTPVGTNRSGLIATPCTLSVDARYLATDEGYGAVAIRQTRDGRAIASVSHPGDSSVCAFSADSRLFATAGSNVVRIWEVATQAEIARIEDAAELRELTFSPSGRYLATIGNKDISRVWLLQSADLIDVACARITRNLTRDERRDYFGDTPYHATCPNIPIPEAEDSGKE